MYAIASWLSLARASATESATGPRTIAEGAVESLRPSAVQIAAGVAQSAVADRLTVTSSTPSRRTNTVMLRFCPATARFTATVRATPSPRPRWSEARAYR